ncbi:unnamed protein product, partial [Arabidopsis halleri]
MGYDDCWLLDIAKCRDIPIIWLEKKKKMGISRFELGTHHK